jgi:hypothetical protein
MIYPVLPSVYLRYGSRRRHCFESLCTLRLPGHLSLPIHLSRRLEFLTTVKKNRAQNDCVRSHDFLVVVSMCRAVRAIVAVDSFAGVTVVGISLQAALRNLEGGFGDDLVERVGAAAEVFAGVAVAAVVSEGGGVGM